MPTASAAIEIRPPSRTRSASTNPSPCLPHSCDDGTRQSVRIISLVGEQRMPSLFSFLPERNPAVPFSTRNAEIPCEDAARSVTAITTHTSATWPLVVNVLLPLITQQSRSSTARLCVPRAQDPCPGSVIAREPIHSPEASLGR